MNTVSDGARRERGERACRNGDSRVREPRRFARPSIHLCSSEQDFDAHCSSLNSVARKPSAPNCAATGVRLLEWVCDAALLDTARC